MYTYSSKQVKNYYINPSYYVSYFNLRSTSIFSQLDTCKTKTTSEIEACLLLDSPTIKSVMSKSCERKNNREIDMETQCNCTILCMGIYRNRVAIHTWKPIRSPWLSCYSSILSCLCFTQKLPWPNIGKQGNLKAPKPLGNLFLCFLSFFFVHSFFPLFFCWEKTENVWDLAVHYLD